MPAPGACLALTVWTQVTAAFILPTAVLASLQRHRVSAQQDEEGEEGEWPVPTVCFVAAQLVWLLLRIALNDAAA